MIKFLFKHSSGLLLLILIFLSNSFSPLKANEQPAGETRTDSLNASELIRGERLFYGLVYRDERSVNCAGCHNTKVIDTLNWNPNAYEISLKYENKSAEDLKSVLLNPRGAKLQEVHADVDLTDADIVMIKGYMDEFAEMGLQKEKPRLTDLIFFILAVLLFLFALADLIFIKSIRFKWIHLIIILASAGYITKTLVEEAIDVGRQQYYSPLQPIKFSHAVHAGQNQTDCKYCHSSVTYSKTAGIPGTGVCMNCHLVVRNGSRSGQYEIAKVVQAHENDQPIEWIRIHNLPDHVYFNHSQHTGAGHIDCSECHGNVDAMDQIIQVSDLSMGWCIECHRAKQVDFHGNDFYRDYEHLKRAAGFDEGKGITVEDVGGTECMKCHY